MSSYKTFLNGVRAAVKKVECKVDGFIKRANDKYSELAYIERAEQLTDVWAGEVGIILRVSGAIIEAGNEYLVTINGTEYRRKAQFVVDGETIGAVLNLPDVFQIVSSITDNVTYIQASVSNSEVSIKLVTPAYRLFLTDYIDKLHKEALEASEKADSTANEALVTMRDDTRVFSIAETVPSYGETALTDVSYPFATSMAESCFSGFEDLRNVSLPRITAISKNAFSGCMNLRKFTIPDSVKTIGDKAFYNCGLYFITYTGTMEQWNAITKGTDWNTNVPATEVVCSDGSVPLA